MKNDSIVKQIKVQEQEMQYGEREIATNNESGQENLLSFNLENKRVSRQDFDTDKHIANKQESNISTNLSFNQGNNLMTNLLMSLVPLEIYPYKCSDISKEKRPTSKKRKFPRFKKKTIALNILLQLLFVLKMVSHEISIEANFIMHKKILIAI